MNKQDVKEKIESIECVECGQLVLFDEVQNHNGDSFCQPCFDENFLICFYCDSTKRSSEVFFVDDETYCVACYDATFFQCQSCDSSKKIITRYTTATGRSICEDCYQDNYFTCDNCGEIFHTDSYGTDGECSDCYSPPEEDEEEPDYSNIHDYSFKPKPHFLVTKKEMAKNLLKPVETKTLFFGVELECANDGHKDNDEIALEVLKIGNTAGLFGLQEDHLYLKKDSSIDPDGFEIVTHPATLDYHLQRFKWGEITSFLSSKGYTSHNNKTCGLHIHVSKNFFSQVEQVKLALFVYGNREAMEKLSRRSSVYAAFKDVKKEIKDHQRALEHSQRVIKEAIDNVPKFEKFAVVINNNYRREAVNYDNHNTIEFRMYRGTLKKETIFATLELTDGICRFVKCHNSAECSSSSSWSLFSSFIKNQNYRFLPQYLQCRGIK